MIVVVLVMPFVLGAPEPQESPQGDVEVLSARLRAGRAYRARQKAKNGTTATPTSAERQRRYRARQRATLSLDDEAPAAPGRRSPT
jgi:hypothetical protein